MKQAVLLIDCYLYGTIAVLAVVLLVLVYLHGQANHLPNPFTRKNIVYRPAPKARGVLLGKNMVCWRTHQSRTRDTLS